MNITGYIPARYASTRFPGKPLALIGGKMMIQRVYERARQAASLTRVVVLTDDARIYDHVLGFGGEAEMTLPTHRTGTDRIMEVALRPGGPDACINIQGDEPFIHPGQIDKVAEMFFVKKGVYATTLVRPFPSEEELRSPNSIKVVRRADGAALYFSRSVIPFQRDTSAKPIYWQHIGIYGYTREALEFIQTLEPSALELAESLEQLRWLENGVPIYVNETEGQTISVDVPEDLLKAEAWLKQSGGYSVSV